MQKKTFSEAYSLLNPAQRKKGVVVVFLLVTQSLLDFFSLASFLQLIFLIVNPSLISTNPYIKSFYDQIGFSSPVSFIVFITVAFLVFTVIKNLLSVGIAKTKAAYAFGIGADLSARAVEWYSSKSYLDFAKADFSREVNLIANYPFAYANNIILPVAALLSESLVCLFIVAGMALYDYKILLFLALILLPIILFYQYRKKGLDKIRVIMKEQYPLSLKYTLQIVEGLVEIKASGKEGFFKDRFKAVNRKLAGAFTKDHIIQTSTSRLTEIITAFIVCVLILYAVTTQQNYQQTILLLSIYASASFRIIPSVNRLLHSSLQFRTHEHLVQELKVLQHYRPEQHAVSMPPILFQERVELRNMSIQYPGGPLILQNARLVIRKGEKIAMTGKSGEGKTTLLLILLGFLKSDEGEILVDGKKIDHADSFRKLLGYVPQSPYILDGTLAENIAFGIVTEEIDRTKVLRLIDDLELGELIRQLPEGIDTRIGERGVKLSGGQRQRLAIARALYAEAEILLLDEVTNQVHASMELEIMNLLDRLAARKKTIIIVTHKIPDTGFFDSIYRLEKGVLHEVALQA